MKRIIRYIAIIVIIVIVALLFLFINAEFNKDDLLDNTTEKNDTSFMNIPIFNQSTEITDSLNDSFWNSINLSSTLNLSCYITNTSILEVHNWYLAEIGYNWQINSEGQFANNETLEIEKSYLKYQHQNQPIGLYIYIAKKPEVIDFNFENIFCIAVGSWDEIYKNGISSK